jgi:RNA processing factor Prp31
MNENCRGLYVRFRVLVNISGGEFQEELERKEQMVQDLTGQIGSLQSRANEITSRHEAEISTIVQEKESTLSIVESQVKKTLAGKEDTIQSLKRRVEELGVQNSHYEEMIETQRSEIVSLVK